MSAKTKKKPRSEKSASATSKHAPTGPAREQSQKAASPGDTTARTEQPPPGLDAAKHARAQLAARGAELLREGIFPSLMATAVGFEKYVDVQGFKVFLSRLMSDLGNPTDPIERMLAEQLALTHFRVAALHASAGEAKSQDAVKILNAACARLLGEFRRSCLTLRALRTPPTAHGKSTKLKLFRMAK